MQVHIHVFFDTAIHSQICVQDFIISIIDSHVHSQLFDFVNFLNINYCHPSFHNLVISMLYVFMKEKAHIFMMEVKSNYIHFLHELLLSHHTMYVLEFHKYKVVNTFVIL